MISIQDLCALLVYSPETGLLTWRRAVADKIKAGQVAGSLRKDGYIAVTVSKNRLLAHRVAWAIHNGRWPAGKIDHRNGTPSDNRIENLRDVSQGVNLQNQRRAKSHSKTGILGSHPDKKKFAARIVINGKRKSLGNFDTPEEAGAAYLAAKRRHHEGCTL